MGTREEIQGLIDGFGGAATLAAPCAPEFMVRFYIRAWLCAMGLPRIPIIFHPGAHSNAPISIEHACPLSRRIDADDRLAAAETAGLSGSAAFARHRDVIDALMEPRRFHSYYYAFGCALSYSILHCVGRTSGTSWRAAFLNRAVQAGLLAFAPRADALHCVLRPKVTFVGGRLHCEDGPAAIWRDRTKSFFWNGVPTSEKAIMTPDLLTLQDVLDAPRELPELAIIERLGWEKFAQLVEPYRIVLDDDPDWGQLCQYHDWRWVKVWNSTPDPDGSRRPFILPVDFLLRPLPRPGRTDFGPRQRPTALNAVASTFGMCGEEYARIAAES